MFFLGEWGYSSTHSELRHAMEVSGQLYALAALLLWKEPSVPTEQDAGWNIEEI
jgi:hypothetical protein